MKKIEEEKNITFYDKDKRKPLLYSNNGLGSNPSIIEKEDYKNFLTLGDSPSFSIIHLIAEGVLENE